MRYFLIWAVFFNIFSAFCQEIPERDSLSLLFMGDIMGHDSQINSAMQPDSSYNYTECFSYLKPIISSVDMAVANLEVTLAGPPYKGYPQFSSPDALAIAAEEAGVDVMGTANNHCLDRGKNGLIRTVQMLDSLNISHTGTFSNAQEKNFRSPLLIKQNHIKVALISYTYGTNGIPVPSPVMVNIINLDSMAADIENARAAHPDKVILFIHWGIEYQREPNTTQQDIAKFCFNKGVDIIIGSHPHVIQKSVWVKDRTLNKEHFITYSLGNFLSNQRQPGTDGGQLIKLVLEKNGNQTQLVESGYYLTWVYTPVIDGKKHFYVLPVAEYETRPEFFSTVDQFDMMKTYLDNSRKLLDSQNINVHEYLFKDDKWIQHR